MFDIFFESGDPVAYDEDGWLGLRGRTVLGDFEETFVAPLGWWSRDAFERQWIEAANRLIVVRQPSAFVLEPARRWWTAWVVGADVLIRQQLLVSPKHADAWRDAPKRIPYELVDHDPGDTEEAPPSEWSVSLVDVENFLARRSLDHLR